MTLSVDGRKYNTFTEYENKAQRNKSYFPSLQESIKFWVEKNE